MYSPASESCVELQSQGPCPAGSVVVAGPHSATLACDCGPHLTQNYWPATRQCYPLYGRGPCREGSQFRLVQAGPGRASADRRPACIVWGGRSVGGEPAGK